MESTKGWIKLHRQILDNELLSNDATAYLVFTKLLLIANSKGEIALSGRQLALRLDVNHSTLYKTLTRLENEGLVKQLSKHRYTLIDICNWSKYQSTGKHFGKRTVNGRETDGKHTTGVSRIENKNKEESVKYLEKFYKSKSMPSLTTEGRVWK